MTPKPREVLSNLQRQLFAMESCSRRLWRKLSELELEDCLESAQARDKGDFSLAEISGLLGFNQRLAELEQHLCELSATECASLHARILDTNDPLDDYEIEATLYFMLHEDDPAFDDDEDNFLTQRQINLKHLPRDWGLGDGLDHRVPVRCFPGALNEVFHCWLFHDLYDHCYSLEQPALTLQDCLRVGSIWVDVAVHKQATLDIKTGKWLEPIDLVT